MSQNISYDQLAELMDSGREFDLLDTLPRTVFDEGHLPGAINIVSDEILMRAPQELLDREQIVVVYCASAACQRAGLAAERLESLGYTNIFHYVEGKRDWLARGQALEKD